MIIYWELFYANFIANMLGYGGGPATLPLLKKEIVDNYGLLTNQEFSEVVAFGNGLPGPIATKMAAFIGYDQAGILGALISLFATVAPTLIILIVLMSILMKYKDSPKVKRLKKVIIRNIDVLLALMTFHFIADLTIVIVIFHTIIIVLFRYFFLEIRKVSPAFVIIGALVYGGIFLRKIINTTRRGLAMKRIDGDQDEVLAD